MSVARFKSDGAVNSKKLSFLVSFFYLFDFIYLFLYLFSSLPFLFKGQVTKTFVVGKARYYRCPFLPYSVSTRQPTALLKRFCRTRPYCLGHFFTFSLSLTFDVTISTFSSFILLQLLFPFVFTIVFFMLNQPVVSL